ncbi:MAG: DUF6799 domain-containing protein [Ferruginibacter sp.]
MKRLVIIAIGLFFNISVNAQIKMTDKEDTKLSPTKTDGLLMQDGKMMQMKEGQAVEIPEDITLKNGTLVTKDGKVTTKDGKLTSLENGDWIMTDGTIQLGPPKKKESSSN